MKENFLFILVILVLITAPALAGAVDVVNESDFGTFTATKSSTSPPGRFGFVLSVDVRVWLDAAGTYTYVYEFSDHGTSFIGISSLSIAAADFDSSLNWGAVGDDPALPSALNVVFGEDQLTFQFTSSLPSTDDTYTVYAQSKMGPKEYLVSAFGFGASGTTSTLGADPPDEPTIYVAEAPSLLFFRHRPTECHGIRIL